MSKCPRAGHDSGARALGAHIAEILSVRHGVHLLERTLREHLQKRGLTRGELVADQRNWSRYESSEPNQRWIADVLVGPFVLLPKAKGSRHDRVFLIVDDHSRLLVRGRWLIHSRPYAPHVAASRSA